MALGKQKAFFLSVKHSGNRGTGNLPVCCNIRFAFPGKFPVMIKSIFRYFQLAAGHASYTKILENFLPAMFVPFDLPFGIPEGLQSRQK